MLRSTVCAVALVPLFVGCTLLEGPTPETPPRETPAAPEVAPEFVPEGSAEENLPIFTETLRQYSEGDTAIEGQPIVDAIANVGFNRDDMQVSFDRTKTDLVADHIFVSVRVDQECLIGQVVTDDRSFVTEVMPAVGPEENICLIGETRAIDW